MSDRPGRRPPPPTARHTCAVQHQADDAAPALREPRQAPRGRRRLAQRRRRHVARAGLLDVGVGVFEEGHQRRLPGHRLRRRHLADQRADRRLRRQRRADDRHGAGRGQGRADPAHPARARRGRDGLQRRRRRLGPQLRRRHDRQDLRGRHQEVERPRDQGAQPQGEPARPGHRGRPPVGLVRYDRRVHRLPHEGQPEPGSPSWAARTSPTARSWPGPPGSAARAATASRRRSARSRARSATSSSSTPSPASSATATSRTRRARSSSPASPRRRPPRSRPRSRRTCGRAWSGRALPTAYPITATTFMLVYQNQKDPAKAKALVNFLTWALTTGQNFPAAINFAPMGKILQQRALQQVNKITLDGKPLVKIPISISRRERSLSRGGRTQGAGAAPAAPAPWRYRLPRPRRRFRGADPARIRRDGVLPRREGLAGAQSLRRFQLPRLDALGAVRGSDRHGGRESLRRAPVRLRHGADVVHRDAARGSRRRRARALHHRRGAGSTAQAAGVRGRPLRSRAERRLRLLGHLRAPARAAPDRRQPHELARRRSGHRLRLRRSRSSGRPTSRRASCSRS